MPGTDCPLVSVIMPYYNGRKFMREAVCSVVEQTYRNIEIVVVDDASPDKEDCRYIEQLSKELGFKLITHETNKGICQAMVSGVIASNGEYIAELSQDDLYDSKKIELQINELVSKDLDAVYVVGDVLSMDSGTIVEREGMRTQSIVESGHAVDALKIQNLSGISMQGLLAKRTVFENDIVPIWQDYLLDDWPVNVRLFEKYKVGLINKPLWTARAHDSNTSHNIWKWLGPQIEVIARMTPEHLKAEAIGRRLASMARRLHKQEGDQDAVVRLAFAGLMLADSDEQYKKASRILKRNSSKIRKAITTSKCEMLENLTESQSDMNVVNNFKSMCWQNFGKEIYKVVDIYQGSKRLSRIGECFTALAFNLINGKHPSMDRMVRFALAGLLLIDDRKLELQTAEMLRRALPQCELLLKDKCGILRAKSRWSFSLGLR